MKQSKHLIVLILLFIFAFAVRLIALNQSLWLDEGITARVVSEYDLSGIISQFLPLDFHPPLYYFIVYLVSKVAGHSEIVLRLPSVIASIITGIFVYKIAEGMKVETSGNRWTAFFATAFFLFNPLIVYYSQEARMYMVATMFITMGVYYVKGRESRGASLKAGICFALALATFYGSVLIIIPVLGFLLLARRYSSFFVICLLLFIISAVLSPLLYKQLLNAHIAVSVVTNWKAVLGTASAKNLLLIFTKFMSGRISFEPKVLYFAIAGLWSMVTWFFVFKGGLRHKFFLSFIIVTLLLGTVCSFFTPLLQYFRFLFLLPIVSVLIATGVRKTVFRSLILAGFVVWSLAYLLVPSFHREDWSGLARLIDSSKPIYAIPASMDALYYYRSDLKPRIKDLRRVSSLVSRDPLTIIPYTSDIYGFDYGAVLGTMGYVQQEKQTVRMLTVETWYRK